ARRTPVTPRAVWRSRPGSARPCSKTRPRGAATPPHRVFPRQHPRPRSYQSLAGRLSYIVVLLKPNATPKHTSPRPACAFGQTVHAASDGGIDVMQIRRDRLAVAGPDL